jgi:Tol biopolymer transport system component
VTVVTELAFLSARDLWLASPERERTRLTAWGDVEYFEWSPDGHKLACFRQPVAGMDTADLWVISADGSGAVLIESGIYFSNFAVTGASLWHPNSSELAYGLGDGRTLRLKSLAGAVRDLAAGGYISGGPWWHPGGKTIAYTALEETAQLVLRGRNDEFIVNLPFIAGQGWFPDGSGMVVARCQIEELSGYLFFKELAAVNEKGEDYRVLYTGPAGGSAPLLGVSPAGKAVALGSYDSLRLVDGLTGAVSVLAGQDVMITYSEFSYPVRFAWSPGGDRLAALLYTQGLELGDGYIEGFWDLAVINISSGGTRTAWEKVYRIGAGQSVFEVLPMDGWMEPLTWSPDGREILVLQPGAGGGFDLWRVDAVHGGAPELYLENARHPAYRPGR